jgi:hypothetical protein
MTPIVFKISSTMIDDLFNRHPIVVQNSMEIGKLNKLSADLEVALVQTTEHIKSLMNNAVQKGWQAVQDQFIQVKEFVSDKMQTLANKAQEFQELIMKKINEIFHELNEMILATLKAEMKLDGIVYQIESFEIEHRLKLSGEIGFGIESLCKFASEGEIGLKGSYKQKS